MKRIVLGYIVAIAYTVLTCLLIKAGAITFSDPLLQKYGSYAIAGFGYLIATYICGREHNVLAYAIIPACALLSFAVSIICFNGDYFVPAAAIVFSFIGLVVSRIMHQ